jgi:hypothetical protein
MIASGAMRPPFVSLAEIWGPLNRNSWESQNNLVVFPPFSAEDARHHQVA